MSGNLIAVREVSGNGPKVGKCWGKILSGKYCQLHECLVASCIHVIILLNMARLTTMWIKVLRSVDISQTHGAWRAVMLRRAQTKM